MPDFPKPLFEHPYYYLWHLVALRVIQVDETTAGDVTSPGPDECPVISDTVWDLLNRHGNTGRKSRIAMIDVGCSRTHPNLSGRLNAELSIDLVAHPFGAKISAQATADGADTSARFFAGLTETPPPWDGLNDQDKNFLVGFTEALANSQGVIRRFGDVEEKFGSHGTAIAGLIVGGPAPETAQSDEILPYFGVDPFSELISIRTSFDNDPAQILAAFLYAWIHQSDVIVLPRSLPDPVASQVAPKNDLLDSLEDWRNRDRNDLYEHIQTLEALANQHEPQAPMNGKSSERLWRIISYLVVEISKTIPIICAAGNEGESQMIFPANLADRENGIVAVGAVTSEGLRSGYSNYGEGLTVVAPSDDMEVYNRYQVRTIWEEYEARKDQFPIPQGCMTLPYSPLGLLSTDLPGSYGYDGETLPGFKYRELKDPRTRNGYYTTFGGTSGACAQVAGVVSLIRRAERLAAPSAPLRDGPDIKSLLRNTARLKASSVLPGGSVLSGDNMNAPDEDAHPEEYFFGSGLVDAKAAIETVLADTTS